MPQSQLAYQNSQIALTRSASVPFKKQKLKPLERNHYKLNQRAYKASYFQRASVLTENYKFDSHGERAKTAILPKHWTVNCLDKIDQRAITKEKNHLNIFRYIHYKHNQMEYKDSFQSS